MGTKQAFGAKIIFRKTKKYNRTHYGIPNHLTNAPYRNEQGVSVSTILGQSDGL